MVSNGKDIPSDVINLLYNSEKKLSFIEEQYGNQDQKSIEVIARFFGNLGKIEKEKEKDLLNFNVIEIESIFRTLKIAVRGTFNNRKNIIKKYFEWGIGKKYIPINTLDMFNNLVFDHIFDQNNLKSKYFKNVEDLFECLMSIVNASDSDDKHRYDTIICAVLLVWCGIPTNNPCILKIENIDLNQGIVKLDKEYIIPKFVCDFISEFLSTTSYIGFKKGSKGKVYYYKDTGYLLRTTTNSSIVCYSQSGLQSRISTWFTKGIDELDENNEYFEHTLYLKDVRDSGFFWRMYEYEQQNHILIKDIDKEMFLQLKYDNEITDQNMSNYIDIYKSWKQTFYGV